MGTGSVKSYHKDHLFNYDYQIVRLLCTGSVSNYSAITMFILTRIWINSCWVYRADPREDGSDKTVRVHCDSSHKVSVRVYIFLLHVVCEEEYQLFLDTDHQPSNVNGKAAIIFAKLVRLVHYEDLSLFHFYRPMTFLTSLRELSTS